MTNEEWMYATEEDGKFYSDTIAPLPDFWGVSRTGDDSNGIRMEMGSGAHVVKHFKKAIEIVQPKNILEIGTNVGYGAAMLIELSDATVISTDISNRQETLNAAGTLKEKYKERFDFFLRNEDGWRRNQFYDMCFVDGGHDEYNATNDIIACREMGIKYLLFDDVEFQEGVRNAIAKFPQLELVADMFNIKLYKNTTANG